MWITISTQKNFTWSYKHKVYTYLLSIIQQWIPDVWKDARLNPYIIMWVVTIIYLWHSDIFIKNIIRKDWTNHWSQDRNACRNVSNHHAYFFPHVMLGSTNVQVRKVNTQWWGITLKTSFFFSFSLPQQQCGLNGPKPMLMLLASTLIFHLIDNAP